MKKFTFAFVVVVFTLGYATFAFAFLQPFGGRITATNIPTNVICATNPNSPFTIQPGFGPTNPWSVGPGLVSFGQITPGAWILGLYGNSECIQENGPEANPYPVFYSNFYGTSMTFGF